MVIAMARGDFDFSCPFRVRYAEIDAQGILYNAHYLTFFDTAIYAYLRELPYDLQRQVRDTALDFHTVQVAINFRRPVRYDEQVEVAVRPTRLGRASITWGLELHPVAMDDLRASGELVWVSTDQRTGLAQPIAPALHTLLAARMPMPALAEEGAAAPGIEESRGAKESG